MSIEAGLVVSLFVSIALTALIFSFITLMERGDSAKRLADAYHIEAIQLKTAMTSYISSRPAHHRDDHHCALCDLLEEMNEQRSE